MLLMYDVQLNYEKSNTLLDKTRAKEKEDNSYQNAPLFAPLLVGMFMNSQSM
jgi:hypothetical protein